nr:hypothetical protein [uncultured Shinella sp.]
MSADGSHNRAMPAPIEAVARDASQPVQQVVANRIGNETALAQPLPVDREILTGLRKVIPQADVPQSVVTQPSGGDYSSGFLNRLVSFFARTEDATSGTDKIRIADDPGRTRDGDKVSDLNHAIDRLEQSQQFATGMTLMSSLTQSVMSSSKRLTQGQ